MKLTEWVTIAESFRHISSGTKIRLPDEGDNGVLNLDDASAPIVNGQRVRSEIDGIAVPYALALQAMESGSAVQIDGPRAVPVIFNGKKTFAYLTAFADGYTGFVPMNATYAGNGFLKPRNAGVPTLHSSSRVRDNVARINGVSWRDKNGRPNERHLVKKDPSNWMPWYHPNRKLKEDAVKELEKDVKAILTPDCEKFIQKLLNTAAAVNPANSNFRVPNKL